MVLTMAYNSFGHVLLNGAMVLTMVRFRLGSASDFGTVIQWGQSLSRSSKLKPLIETEFIIPVVGFYHLYYIYHFSQDIYLLSEQHTSQQILFNWTWQLWYDNMDMLAKYCFIFR